MVFLPVYDLPSFEKSNAAAGDVLIEAVLDFAPAGSVCFYQEAPLDVRLPLETWPCPNTATPPRVRYFCVILLPQRKQIETEVVGGVKGDRRR